MNKNQISKMALMGLASGLMMSAQGVASEESTNAQTLAAGCGSSGQSRGYSNAGSSCSNQGKSRGYTADTYYNTNTSGCNATNASRGYTTDANYTDAYNTNATIQSNEWQTRGDNSYRSTGPEYRIETYDNTPYRGNSSYYDQQSQGYYSNDPYYSDDSGYYNGQYGSDNFGGGRQFYYYNNENVNTSQQQLRTDTNAQTYARLLSEKDLLAQLNEQGKDQYNKLDEQGKLLARKLAAQPGYTDKNKAVRDAFQIRSNVTTPTNSNINR